MTRFIVVFLASLFVVGLLTTFFPSISNTAFVVPTHQMASGTTIGGFGISWSIIVLTGCIIGLAKMAAK